MTTRLEGDVRAALDDLTSAAPPPDLAHGAIRRAGRQRVARLSLGAVAVVAAVSVGVPLVAGGAASGPEPGPAQGPAARTFVVTAYSGLSRGSDRGPADDTSLLLDPATARYEEVPYNEVVPAPDGGPVLVHAGDNSLAHPSRWGLLDRASDAVRWLDLPHPGYTTHGAWSPDGRRLLFTSRPRQGGGGFVVVDATSLSVYAVTVPDDRNRNAIAAGFAWTPDGTGVVLVRSTEGEEQSVIDLYDLTGRPTASVPVQGRPGGAGTLSPDGRNLAVDPLPGDDRFRIVDPATGAVRHEFTVPDAGPVVGWYDATRVMVRSYGDRDQGVQPALLLVDLAGTVIRSVPLLADGVAAQEVRVGPAAGLSGEAWRLAF